MKYLDPKADLTFKRVFGEHPDLVMSLLNALLPISVGQEITDIEYLPAEIVPDGIATPRPGITIRSMNRQKYRKTPSFPSQGSKTNIISLSYYALLIARKPLT